MPQSTRHDTKSNSREHVGIVALARIKSLSTRKGNGIKRTAAGKNGATLQDRHTTVKRGRVSSNRWILREQCKYLVFRKRSNFSLTPYKCEWAPSHDGCGKFWSGCLSLSSIFLSAPRGSVQSTGDPKTTPCCWRWSNTRGHQPSLA